jgi:hypothetical protein
MRLREAVTDAGGRFRLEALDARAHDLTVTADPYAPLYREVDAAEGEVDLGDILLEKGLTIRGLVFDPQQRPCARARVSASRPERSVRAGNSIPRLARAAVREATTDSQGKFELHGLPSGKIDLRAEADDLGAAVLSGIEAGAKDVTLTLAEGNEIHGKVTDAATGAAVVDAEIEIGFTDPKTARSGDSGEFVVRGFLLREEPSRHDVDARHAPGLCPVH